MDLKRKLSSRKFWVAIIGFITTILTAFNVDNLTIEQVTAITGGVAGLITYILAEGYVDEKRSKDEIVNKGDDGEHRET